MQPQLKPCLIAIRRQSQALRRSPGPLHPQPAGSGGLFVWEKPPLPRLFGWILHHSLDYDHCENQQSRSLGAHKGEQSGFCAYRCSIPLGLHSPADFGKLHCWFCCHCEHSQESEWPALSVHAAAESQDYDSGTKFKRPRNVGRDKLQRAFSGGFPLQSESSGPVKYNAPSHIGQRVSEGTSCQEHNKTSLF